MELNLQNIEKCIQKTSVLLNVKRDRVVHTLNTNENLKKIKDVYYSALKIDILGKTQVPFTTYKGVPLNEILGLIYLLKNNKGVCAPLKEISELYDYIEDFDVGIYALSWDCIFKNGKCIRKLRIPHFFKETFKRCLKNVKVRFVIIPLNMNYKDDDEDDSSPHSNYLIYDKELNEIERYEPNGTTIYESDHWYNVFALDKSLKKFFQNQNIKYISPLMYCPRKGLQAIEHQEYEEAVGWERNDPGGFCSAWSQYWAALRLKNPNTPRDILIKKAISQIDKGFKKFIRAYSEFLMSNKFEILKNLPDDTISYDQEGRLTINPKRMRELRLHINNKIKEIYKELE